jgi:hypothetical protein
MREKAEEFKESGAEIYMCQPQRGTKAQPWLTRPTRGRRVHPEGELSHSQPKRSTVSEPVLTNPPPHPTPREVPTAPSSSHCRPRPADSIAATIPSQPLSYPALLPGPRPRTTKHPRVLLATAGLETAVRMPRLISHRNSGVVRSTGCGAVSKSQDGRARRRGGRQNASDGRIACILGRSDGGRTRRLHW